VHHVYLIPGFFGFSNLGNVLYFRAVRETLAQNFAERGEPLEIFGVRTFPTGSLARRARRVLEEIDKNDSLRRADAIHLIGHSTGGIDARLVASLRERREGERVTGGSDAHACAYRIRGFRSE